MRNLFIAGVVAAWLAAGSAQAGTQVPGSISGAAGIDINYGGARDLQLTCVVPLANEHSDEMRADLAVTRAIPDRLSMDVEVCHRSADAEDGEPFSGANPGATWKASEHWALLGSIGPGVQNARYEGQYSFYLALQTVY